MKTDELLKKLNVKNMKDVLNILKQIEILIRTYSFIVKSEQIKETYSQYEKRNDISAGIFPICDSFENLKILTSLYGEEEVRKGINELTEAIPDFKKKNFHERVSLLRSLDSQIKQNSIIPL